MFARLNKISYKSKSIQSMHAKFGVAGVDNVGGKITVS